MKKYSFDFLLQMVTRLHFSRHRWLCFVSTIVLCLQIGGPVAAISGEQMRALQSGVYYFNTEDDAYNSCFVEVDANLSGNSNAEIAFNFFVSKGLTSIQSAGIVGNFMQESKVNPSAVNSSSKAFGIAQWLGGRYESLKSFVREKGGSLTDLGTQLEFSWHEFSGSEKAALDDLRNQATLTGAAMSVRVKYERPGESEANDPARLRYADMVLKKYGTGGGTVVSAPLAGDACDTSSAGENTKYIDGFTVYSQYDPAWADTAYSSSTIGTSGCGPAAMAMIITTLTGQRVTPVATAKYAADRNQYVPGQGSRWTLPDVVAPKWGLKAEIIGANMPKITATIRAGGLVIVSGQGPKPFTSGGHYIVIRAVTDDGKWLVGDSAHSDTSDKKWDPTQLLASMNDGSVYAVTK